MSISSSHERFSTVSTDSFSESPFPYPLNLIPEELFQIILSQLPPQTLCTLALVCRKFKRLSNDPNLWKRLCQNQPWMPSIPSELDFKQLYTQEACLGNRWLRKLQTTPSLHVLYAPYERELIAFCYKENFLVKIDSIRFFYAYEISVTSFSKDQPKHTLSKWKMPEAPTAITIHNNILYIGTRFDLLYSFDLIENKSLGLLMTAPTTTHCAEKYFGRLAIAFFPFLKGKREGVWLEPHELKVVTIKAQGHRLATLHSSGLIRLWNIETKKHIVSFFKNPLNKGAESCILAFDFHRNTLVTSHKNKEISVWNISSGKIKKNTKPKQRATAVLLEKSSLILGFENGVIQIRDLKTNKCLKTIKAHLGAISSIKKMQFILVSASKADKTIKFWNLKYNLKNIKPLMSLHGFSGKNLFIHGYQLVSQADEDSIIQWKFRLFL